MAAKTMVAATVAIAALCWTPQDTQAAADLYDDFSSPLIDRTKWTNLEFVRQIDNGVLKSELRRFGSSGSNTLSFADPDAVSSFQADVTVTAVSITSARARARLTGNFYNDGTAGGGLSGEVFAGIEIRDSGAGLHVRFVVGKCNNSDCSSDTVLISDDTTFGTVNLGETHTLSLAWDGTQFFTFGFDGNTAQFDSAAVVPVAGPSISSHKVIVTRVSSIAGPNEGAHIKATFDNVRVTGAIDYTFTKIADTSGDFATFENSLGGTNGPALNNSGTVAFTAILNAGGEGVFTSDGTSLNTIASAAGPFAFGSDVAINDTGTVVFLGSDPCCIIRSDGTTTDVIASFSTPPGFGGFSDGASINTAGTVAFGTQVSGGEPKVILTSSGGPLTTIADTSGPLDNFFGQPDINNVETVVFAAEFDAGGQAIITIAGGTTSTILDTDPLFDTSDFFGAFGANIFNGGPTINTSGAVAFSAELTSGDRGIVTVAPGGAPNVVVDAAGPLDFFAGGGISINDVGSVAFHANLDAGGSGVFTGPDPVTDKVIATGDSLFGSVVTDVFYSRAGLNDNGQVAFLAFLADGTEAIVRADPPEPFLSLFDQVKILFEPFQPIIEPTLVVEKTDAEEEIAQSIAALLEQARAIEPVETVEVTFKDVARILEGLCVAGAISQGVPPGSALTLCSLLNPEIQQFIINELETIQINPRFQLFDLSITATIDLSVVDAFVEGDLFVSNFPFVGFSPSFSLIEVEVVIINEEDANLELRIEGLSQVPEPVVIDIKPRKDPNSINTRSGGKIPVAIISTADFDAFFDVAQTSLTFGRTGDEDSLAFCAHNPKDFNSDGLPDLLCRFNIRAAGFEQSDTEGILKGQTVDGTPIIGTDTVSVRP